MRLLALLAVTLAATTARAAGIDRDSLLTDSPAVPAVGTVRVTGGALGTDNSNGGASPSGASSVSGSIGWTPFANLHADVGAYAQVGASGPSARVRYQFLSQAEHGLDLSAGVRLKTVGFHPNNGEFEALLAAGRRFGKFELVLNGVLGQELGGEQGKDLEIKGFAGYRFNESVRAGLDSRLQAELADEQKSPTRIGRDYDLTAGPAISWLIGQTVQVQALVGVAQPKKTNLTAPVGVVSASIDF